MGGEVNGARATGTQVPPTSAKETISSLASLLSRPLPDELMTSILIDALPVRITAVSPFPPSPGILHFRQDDERAYLPKPVTYRSTLISLYINQYLITIHIYICIQINPYSYLYVSI